MHTGDILHEILLAHNVRHVFGLPGEQTLPLYEAIQRNDEIQHIVMRDERNLPYAALAYSRVSGHVGVLDATVGPGVALLPLGLLEALHSATPVAVIASDLPMDMQMRSYMGAASQGMDQVGFLQQVTKWTGKASNQKQVPQLVTQLFQQAAGGRPGPAAAIIPKDIFFEENAESLLPLPKLSGHAGMYPQHRFAPDPRALEAAASLIRNAARPLLVAGGGVLHSRAADALLAFAEQLNVPVATTLTGKGAIAETHRLALGAVGSMGTTAAEEAARNADLLIFIGFRGAQNSTFMWKLPKEGQKVIHADIDAEQPGRHFPCDVALIGDARSTLEAFVAVLNDIQDADRTAWLNETERWKQRWIEFSTPQLEAGDTPIHPQRVVAEITKASGANDVLVSDASFASGWAAVYHQVQAAGRRLILPRGMAGLGFGLPAAVGAKAALPNGNVFLLAGDGGFAYSLGELITLKAYGLKVICVILNNRSWGWMEWVAKLNYDKELFHLPDVNFAKVAEAVGLNGVRVQQPSGLGGALQQAIESDESTLIEVESAIWQAPLRTYTEALNRRKQQGEVLVSKYG